MVSYSTLNPNPINKAISKIIKKDRSRNQPRPNTKTGRDLRPGQLLNRSVCVP